MFFGEPLMNTDYWHQRWQANELGFNQAHPHVLLQRYFNDLNLKSGARILVPLCGKSIDMLWLLSQGYELIGVELSSLACSAFFTEHQLSVTTHHTDHFTMFQGEKITLLAGDFFELNQETLGSVAAVYDRAALVALPSELRQRYAAHLITLLQDTSSVFLITTSYNQESMQGPPFSVDEAEVIKLYGAHFHIKQRYNKSLKAIPPHLQAKGLREAHEQVYCLTQGKSNTFKQG